MTEIVIYIRDFLYEKFIEKCKPLRILSVPPTGESMVDFESVTLFVTAQMQENSRTFKF